MKLISKAVSAACGLALLLAVLAAPASAGTHVDRYSAELYLSLQHKRTGVDSTIANVYWTRETNLRAQLKTLADGLDFEDGKKLPGPRPLVPKAVYGTGVEDQILITVDGGLMTATCVNDGQGKASPGQISFRRAKVDGAPGFEVVVRPFNTFQVNAYCSGFSSATGIFDFSSDAPVATAKLPLSAVGSRMMRTKLDGTAPCPVTAQTESTTFCESKWTGQLTLELSDSFDRGSKEDREPSEPVSGDGPTGNPMVDAAIATINRGLGKGTVKVPCPKGCTGKISAYAVARERERKGLVKPRLIGKGELSSPARGGIGKGSVSFDRGDQALLRERGAVSFRISAQAAGGRPVRGEITVNVPGR